jgi:superfamily II DNA or RNA helicase
MLSARERDRVFAFVFALASTERGAGALTLPLNDIHAALEGESFALGRELQRFAWRAVTTMARRGVPTLLHVIVASVFDGSDDEVPLHLDEIARTLTTVVGASAALPQPPGLTTSRPVDLRPFVDALIEAVRDDARPQLRIDVDGTRDYVEVALEASPSNPSLREVLTLEAVFSGRFAAPRRYGPSVPAHVHQKFAALHALARAGASLGAPRLVARSLPTVTTLLDDPRVPALPRGLERHIRSLVDLLRELTPRAHAHQTLVDLAAPHVVSCDVSFDGSTRFLLAPKRTTYVELIAAPAGYEMRRAPDVSRAEREHDDTLLSYCIGITLHLLLDPLSDLHARLVERFARTPAERLMRDLERAAVKVGESQATRGSEATVDDELSWGLALTDDVVPIDARGGEHWSLAAWVRPRTKKGAQKPLKRMRASTLLARGPEAYSRSRDLLALLAADERDYRSSTQTLDALLSRLRRDEAPTILLELLRREEVREARVRFTRPMLSLEEVPGGVAFKVRIGSRTLDAAELTTGAKGFFVVDKDEGELTLHVVPGSRALEALGDTFAQHPSVLHVPNDDRARLVALIEGVARDAVDLTLSDALAGDEVTASHTVTVQLSRRSTGGVRVRLGHRAFPTARLCAPDEGSERVPGVDDGRRVCAVRSREDERTRIAQTIASLMLDDEDLTEPCVWDIDGLERALAVVERAHALTLRTGADGAPALHVEWSEGSARLVVAGHVDARALRLSIGQAGRWLSLEGEATVDEQRVHLHHMMLAMREGRRYVALDDGRFVRIEDTLRAELELLSVSARVKGNRLELGLEASPHVVALVDQGSAVRGREVLDALAARVRAADLMQPKVPATLQASLRAYQHEGFAWLMRLAAWGTGGVLADEMGLGKTVQAIAVLLARACGGPALVVAPTSVVSNWARELARFAPTLRVVTYAGSERASELASLSSSDILLVSYALLARDEMLVGVRFHTAIFDEAQALKNKDTMRAKRAAALTRDWSFALTGTPVENRVSELWSIFHITSPGLFGSFESFARDVITPIEHEKSVVVKRALSRAIRPFMLRRRKRDVALELPPKTEVTVEVEPSAEERALYEAARRAAVEELTGDDRVQGGEDARFRVLALITRLRLLACHPRLFDAQSPVPSSKLARVMATLDDLVASERRALVFSQFTRHLDLLEPELHARRIAFLRLDGSTPAEKRSVVTDAFQRGEASVFLISLKAGGMGLNLTTADDVLHLDPWWNPAVEDQATDRAHRIGQEKPITVSRFVTRGTIEEKIVRLHAEKRALVDDLLAGSDGAAALRVEDLVALVKDIDAPARMTRAKEDRTRGLR